jgi:probable phosphoglycerate mutase
MKQTPTLFLLRHGQTQAEPTWRYTGQREVDLSKSGYNQARRWADCLAQISTIGAVYTSPMNRCVETARLIAERIKCPVYNVAELSEIFLGRWEGLTRQEVDQYFPGAYEARGKNMADFRPPGGESFSDLLARVLPFAIRSLQTRQQTLAVTHAGVIRVLCCHARAMDTNRVFDFHPGPGQMTVIGTAADNMRLLAENLDPADFTSFQNIPPH